MAFTVFSQFREDKQRGSFGFTAPPRIELKATDELCMTKNG